MQFIYRIMTLCSKSEFATGYFERVEKRSPYSVNTTGGINVRRKKIYPFYMFLTVICLLVLYPVGIIMLWNRKFSASAPAKIIITFIATIVFCVLLMLAANVETNNPQVEKIQIRMNEAFDTVYNVTDKAADGIKGGIENVRNAYMSRALDVWNGVKPDVARKGIELLEGISSNAHYLKYDFTLELFEKYKKLVGYNGHDNTEEIITKAENGGMVVSGPTPTKENVFAADPVITVTPKPTVAPTFVPTPTPEPVSMPEIRNVSEAPVYFTDGGTYYHKTSNCMGMMYADSHTLAEAKAAKKKICENCGVVSLTLLERTETDYLWIDIKNVAHTTDICREFAEGGYKIVLLDEVYNGHYNYCPACSADKCFEYMRQQEIAKANISSTDPETRMLYEYEKGITVYYSETSRYYHSTQDCCQMYDDKYTHSLYEALHFDMMNPCPICDPYNEGDCIEYIKSLTD